MSFYYAGIECAQDVYDSYGNPVLDDDGNQVQEIVPIRIHNPGYAGDAYDPDIHGPRRINLNESDEDLTQVFCDGTRVWPSQPPHMTIEPSTQKAAYLSQATVTVRTGTQGDMETYGDDEFRWESLVDHARPYVDPATGEVFDIGRSCIFQFNQDSTTICIDIVRIRVHWREDETVFVDGEIELVHPVTLQILPQPLESPVLNEDGLVTTVQVTPPDYREYPGFGYSDFRWSVIDQPGIPTHAVIKDKGPGEDPDVGFSCTFQINPFVTQAAIKGGPDSDKYHLGVVTDDVYIRVEWIQDPENVFIEARIALILVQTIIVNPNPTVAALRGSVDFKALIAPEKYLPDDFTWTPRTANVALDPGFDGLGREGYFVLNRQDGPAITTNAIVRVEWDIRPDTVFGEAVIELVYPYSIKIVPQAQDAPRRGFASATVVATPVAYTDSDFTWFVISGKGRIVSAPADGTAFQPGEVPVPLTTYVGLTCWFQFNWDLNEKADMDDVYIGVEWNEDPSVSDSAVIHLIGPSSVDVVPETQEAPLRGNASAMVVVAPPAYTSRDFLWSVTKGNALIVQKPANGSFFQTGESYTFLTSYEGEVCWFAFNQTGTLNTETVKIKAEWVDSTPEYPIEDYGEIILVFPQTLILVPESQKAALRGTAKFEVQVIPASYTDTDFKWSVPSGFGHYVRIVQPPANGVAFGPTETPQPLPLGATTLEMTKVCWYQFNWDTTIDVVTTEAQVKVEWMFDATVFKIGFVELIKPSVLRIDPDTQEISVRGEANATVIVSPVEYNYYDFIWTSESAHGRVKDGTSNEGQTCIFEYNWDTTQLPVLDKAIIKVAWKGDLNIFDTAEVTFIRPIKIEIVPNQNPVPLSWGESADFELIVSDPLTYPGDDFTWKAFSFTERGLDDEVSVSAITVSGATVPRKKRVNIGKEVENFLIVAYWNETPPSLKPGVTSSSSDNINDWDFTGCVWAQATVQITPIRIDLPPGYEIAVDSYVVVEAMVYPGLSAEDPIYNVFWEISENENNNQGVNDVWVSTDDYTYQGTVIYQNNGSQIPGNPKASQTGGIQDANRSIVSAVVFAGKQASKYANGNERNQVNLTVTIYASYDGGLSYKLLTVMDQSTITIKPLRISIEPSVVIVPPGCTTATNPTPSSSDPKYLDKAIDLVVFPYSYQGSDFDWSSSDTNTITVTAISGPSTAATKIANRACTITMAEKDSNGNAPTGGYVKCTWQQDSSVYAFCFVLVKDQQITVLPGLVYFVPGQTIEKALTATLKPGLVGSQYLVWSYGPGSFTNSSPWFQPLPSPGTTGNGSQTTSGIGEKSQTKSEIDITASANAPGGENQVIYCYLSTDTSIAGSATLTTTATLCTLNPPLSEKYYGEQIVFTLTVQPSLKSTQHVEWAATDSGVTLAPDSSQIVCTATLPTSSAMQEFKVTATVYEGTGPGKSQIGYAEAIVKYKAFTMKIDPENTDLNPGESVGLTLVPTPSPFPSGETFTWTCTEGTLTPSGDGKTANFTAPSEDDWDGSAITITCVSSSGVTATAYVHIKTAASITITDGVNDVGSVIGNPGQSTPLTAVTVPASTAKTWTMDQSPEWISPLSGNTVTLTIPSYAAVTDHPTAPDEGLITVTSPPESDTCTVFINWPVGITFDDKTTIEAAYYTPGVSSAYPVIVARGTKKTGISPVKDIVGYTDAYRRDLNWELQSPAGTASLSNVTTGETDSTYFNKKVSLPVSLIVESVIVNVSSYHDPSVSDSITISINWPTGGTWYYDGSTDKDSDYYCRQCVLLEYRLVGPLSPGTGPYENAGASAGNYTMWDLTGWNFAGGSTQSVNLRSTFRGNTVGSDKTYVDITKRTPAGADTTYNYGSGMVMRRYRGFYTSGGTTTFNLHTIYEYMEFQTVNIEITSIAGVSPPLGVSITDGDTISIVVVKTGINGDVVLYRKKGSVPSTSSYDWNSTQSNTSATSVTFSDTVSDGAGTYYYLAQFLPYTRGGSFSTGNFTGDFGSNNPAITVNAAANPTVYISSSQGYDCFNDTTLQCRSVIHVTGMSCEVGPLPDEISPATNGGRQSYISGTEDYVAGYWIIDVECYLDTTYFNTGSQKISSVTTTSGDGSLSLSATLKKVSDNSTISTATLLYGGITSYTKVTWSGSLRATASGDDVYIEISYFRIGVSMR